jgi:WD40 repeat protein
LYDAYTGAVRASYRPYNALDELESPVVASFDHSGTKIAAGGYRTDRTLHLFDVAVPGRESTVLRLGKTRRSSDGQKGMVSSMTFSMDDKCLALGTYAPGSIYVYDCRQERPSGSVLSNSGICVVGHGRNHGRKKRRFSAVENRNQHETGGDMEVSGGGDEEESWLNSAKSNWYHSRVQGGVTQLLFSPREYFLFSTSRRSDAVLMWDLRMMSDDPEHLTHPVAGLASYATKNDTNQRLQFELDDAGESLYAGGVDGRIRTYSTITGELIGIIEDRDGHPANGVSFTCAGSSRLLAVTTGARKFPTEKELELDRLPLYCDDYGVGSSPGSLSLYKLQKGSLP